FHGLRRAVADAGDLDDSGGAHVLHRRARGGRIGLVDDHRVQVARVEVDRVAEHQQIDHRDRDDQQHADAVAADLAQLLEHHRPQPAPPLHRAAPPWSRPRVAATNTSSRLASEARTSACSEAARNASETAWALSRPGADSTRRLLPICATLSTPGRLDSSRCARRGWTARTSTLRPSNSAASSPGAPSATSTPPSRIAM